MESQKMKPAIKAQWVAALRSGKYQQTKGRLAVVEDGKPVAFCCLGVLCDLAVKAGAVKADYSAPEAVYDDNYLSLPLKVSTWAGLGGASNPYVPFASVTEERSMLAALNDGTRVWDEEAQNNIQAIRPHSFAEIADIIEEHL